MPHKLLGDFLHKWQDSPVRMNDLMMYYEAARTVLKVENPTKEPTVNQVIEMAKVVVMSLAARRGKPPFEES